MTEEVALALLGLKKGHCSEEQIGKAYRDAMQLNHPDRFTGNERLRAHAEEQCKLINEARATLLNQTWVEDASHEEEEERKEESSPAQEAPEPIKRSYAPLLDLWTTTVSSSALGALVFVVVAEIEYLVPGSLVLAAGLFRLVYMVVQFLYSLVIYPSYFSISPKLHSPAAISFWNCAMGGFIFGPIWNGNITKGRKGVSNIVFASMVGALVLSWLFMFGFAASMLMTA